MRVLLIALLLFFARSSFSHDHDLTTYTIYQLEEGWVLKVDFVTSIVYNSIKSNKKTTEISDSDYKKMVVAYFRDRINLVADNQVRLRLGDCGIKLGQHSSQLIFVLENYDEKWMTLHCSITCLSDNEKQTNLLRIITGKKTFKALLSKKNSFEAIFEQVNIKIK